MEKARDRFFAVAAPGLEAVCAAELTALGMAGVQAVPGGVAFEGELRDLYRANLWLRTASRVLVRVGEFKSRDFPDLYRKAVRLPWGRFLRPGTRVQVRASSHSSRLNHTGRIAETVVEAIARALGPIVTPQDGPEQLVLVRFENDLCQFSVDSSGALLHRRGYREETARAPLRETLAAGILLLLGWDGRVPLVDPMCGSGTFVIEGALLASNLPPGLQRDFAFSHWPRYRPGLWTALLEEARRERREVAVPIVGGDRDPLALAAARRNAERAGVADAIELRPQELAQLVAPAGPGLLVANPPYGERIGQGEDLRPLYRQLGEAGRSHFAGWRAALLCPEQAPLGETRLALAPLAGLSNGGIAVTLSTGSIPGK